MTVHDLWNMELEKGKSSSDAERNQTDSDCSYSVHHGRKMTRYNTNSKNLERSRQKWRLQQQQLKLHQRRKEIFIKEYEIQRKHRLKQSARGEQVLKGPEGTQISSTELRKIKVDIYRNIPGKSAATELQRDIVSPEDVVVKRRAGEGARPIFEREERTKTVSNTEDTEEHRTVVTVKDANLENKPQRSRRRSASLSLTRNRSHNRRWTSPCHSRHENYNKHEDRENRRNNGNRRSKDRSRERKEDRRRTQSCHGGDEEKRLKEKRSRDYSRSRDRDQAKWDGDSHRSNRSIRGRSSERRMLPQGIPVIEQIPIPIYYGNFPPRSIMVGPLDPIRDQFAFRGHRHPMWPIRFPPRMDIYRLRSPGNPRGFRPQY